MATSQVTFTIHGDVDWITGTARAVLEQHGFKVSTSDPWNWTAESGNKTKTMLLGAMGGLYMKIDVRIMGGEGGTTLVAITRGSTGMAGGAINVKKTSTKFSTLDQAMGAAFGQYLVGRTEL